MNTYNNISSELKSCFSSNKILKILLPVDMVLMFGGLIIYFLINVLGIYHVGLISNTVYWAFILGCLLTYANLHNQFLFIGLWSYGAICIIQFLQALFNKYSSFSWNSLFRIAIFGGLGYLVFRHSVTSSSSSKDISG